MRGTNLSGLLSAFQETTSGKVIIGIINLIVGGIVGAIIAKYIQ